MMIEDVDDVDDVEDVNDVAGIDDFDLSTENVYNLGSSEHAADHETMTGTSITRIR